MRTIYGIFSVVILGATIWAYQHYSSAPILRWISRLAPGFIGWELRPRLAPIIIECPPNAYEMQTFELEVRIIKDDWIGAARHFRVEVPEQISLAGEKERKIVKSESWYLTPKEQGEFVVVVRDDQEFVSPKHVSVHRVDHLSKTEFDFAVAISAIIGFLVALKALFKSKENTNQPSGSPKPPKDPRNNMWGDSN